MKKVIVIVGIIVILAVAAFLVSKYNGNLSTQIAKEKDPVKSGHIKKETSKYPQSSEERAESAIESVVKSTQEKREIIGVVKTITDPKKYDVRYLEIRVSVINIEQVKNVDFTKHSAELPMVQEVFKVAVDNSTKLVKIKDKSEIKPGSMVRVVSGRSIYEMKEFSAIELEVISTR